MIESFFFPCLILQASLPVPPSLNAIPAEAIHLDSGLAYRITRNGGEGASPKGNDMVSLHFIGFDGAGKTFANTYSQDDPAMVALDRLMPGMREALSSMKPGEQRRIWVPEALAFQGAEGKPKGTLVMDLEYLGCRPHPSLAPEDVKAPGPEATELKRGLFSRVLHPGSGDKKPGRGSWVRVHYSGWTTDGKLFDSSLLRGSPQALRLTEVIEGWRLGIRTMVVGEHRRFWIPERLAYDGAEGKPAGTLVFDVELVGFWD